MEKALSHAPLDSSGKPYFRQMKQLKLNDKALHSSNRNASLCFHHSSWANIFWTAVLALGAPSARLLAVQVLNDHSAGECLDNGLMVGLHPFR